MPVSFLFLSLLLACRPDTPALDAYTTASCRLLTEPVCLDSQDGSCSYTVSYDSQDDCERVWHRSMRRCKDDVEADLGALDVTACLDALDALECSTTPVCDPTPAFAAGPCSAVYDAISIACSE